MELKGQQGKFKTLKLEANPSSVREACTGNPSGRSKNANKRPRIEQELGHPCACVSACALEHTLLRFFFLLLQMCRHVCECSGQTLLNHSAG